MYIKPLKIRNLLLKSNLFLSPMAEITTYPFRKLCLKNGCDMVISEMISANAIFYKNRKSMDSLKIRDDRPIGIQIFGSNPDLMLNAALIAQDNGADMIEINAGCPVKKITKTGAGSSLMKNYFLLSEIIKRIAPRIKIPLSVKMRIGFNEKEKNAVFLARIIEESGADILHLHLRTVEQHHNGEVDYQIAKEVKSLLHIPIIVNGGITSPLKAVEAFEKTGCDAISIGRGAIKNPFIFKEIKMFIVEKKNIFHTLKDRISAFIEYLDISEMEYGEKKALINSRRIAGMFLSNFINASEIRNEFMRVENIKDAKELLYRLL